MDWKINMLYSEKINFVKETLQKKYFDTEFYGWCDIGYFRCNQENLPYEQIKNWGLSYKLNKTDNEKNWKKKVVEVPKLDYYLDTEDLYITFSPGKHSMIKSSCKLFDGTADELRESSLKKYLKNFDNDN